MLLHMALFPSFYGWVIFHCVCVCVCISLSQSSLFICWFIISILNWCLLSPAGVWSLFCFFALSWNKLCHFLYVVLQHRCTVPGNLPSSAQTMIQTLSEALVSVPSISFPLLWGILLAWFTISPLPAGQLIPWPQWVKDGSDAQIEMWGDIVGASGRESALHWIWDVQTWGLELPEASCGHEADEPVQEADVKAGEKWAPRTSSRWAGPEVGPRLDFQFCKHFFSSYHCKLELDFLLWRLWVTTSTAFWDFWNSRGTLLCQRQNSVSRQFIQWLAPGPGRLGQKG